MARKSKKAKKEEQLLYGVVGLVIIAALFWGLIIKPFFFWVQANPIPGFVAVFAISAAWVSAAFFGGRAFLHRRQTKADNPISASIPALRQSPAPRAHVLVPVNVAPAESQVNAFPRDAKLSKIEAELRSFRPFRSSKELGYHKALAGFLQKEFPHVQVEVRFVHGRPDIVIDDVAIEVKGPTKNSTLTNLPGKAALYLGAYRHLFMVLFEPEYDPATFQQISKDLNRNPNVTVIVKDGGLQENAARGG